MTDLMCTEGPYIGWTSGRTRQVEWVENGRPGTAAALAGALDLRSAPLEMLARRAAAYLAGAQGFHGGVLKEAGTVLAWSDHIRSFPLYYALAGEAGGAAKKKPAKTSAKTGAKRLLISNDARTVRYAGALGALDPLSLLEFSMAGYATGAHTLYEGLKVLEPGSVLVWREGGDAPLLLRWFRYIQTPDAAVRADENAARLGQILDGLTRSIIARAEGRPIWVPLSAGFDSRAILCKLHEQGYRNLHSFTYGPRWNFEAKYARRTAARLGVPWRMVCPPARRMREWFESEARKAFWRYADGLKAIPCMREFAAVKALRESGAMEPESILINGQSGDYITGAHIPRVWFEDGADAGDPDRLYRSIEAKHYDLWQSLRTPENTALLRGRIDELVPPQVPPGAFREEAWEYDARQVCYVANGQRVYEFMGYAWEMPLWEKELVEFYAGVPLEQKRSQSLYKDYLRAWNYRGLFPRTEPYIWRWPAPMLWVVPAARALGLAKGEEAKQAFYARMRYHGHYANQYAFFDPLEHARTCRDARSVISLYVGRWLSEQESETGNQDFGRFNVMYQAPSPP